MIRVFWIEKKKLHKWYFILVSLYFFSRIYILIWLSCLNVSLKSNCLQIVLLFRLYGPREATRMSPTVKVFVSYFWIKEQYVIFTWDRCRIFFYHVGVRGRGGLCQYKLRVRHLSSFWSILDESEISKFNDKVV